MPILGDWPTEVHVLVPPEPGGRSAHGVRRHSVGWPTDAVEDRDGLLITGLARTALDLVLVSEFAPAVGSLDWAMWRRNPDRVEADAITSELDRVNPRYRRGHARSVLEFGTALSDSFGESMTRAVMYELGYEVPELQVSFSDRRGHIGDTDYFWRSERVAGEFDGAAKYMRPEYLGTLTPAQVVWREKKREDRLRRQCNGVVRVVWDETTHPQRLDAVLRESGLRPRHSQRTLSA